MVAIFNLIGIDGIPNPAGRCHLALSQQKLRRRLEAASEDCSLPGSRSDIFLQTLKKEVLSGALAVRSGISPLTYTLDGVLGTCRSRLREHGGDVGFLWLASSPILLLLGAPLGILGASAARCATIPIPKRVLKGKSKSVEVAGEVGCLLPLYVATQSGALITLAPKLLGTTLGSVVGGLVGLVRGSYEAAKLPRRPKIVDCGDECKNAETLVTREPLSAVPQEYFFRTSDGWGFDVRELATFITGRLEWQNPYTMQALSPDDIARLIRHRSGAGLRLRKALRRTQWKGEAITGRTVEAMQQLAAVLATDDGSQRSVEALGRFVEYYGAQPVRERKAIDLFFEACSGEVFSAVAADVTEGRSCSHTFGTALKGALRKIGTAQDT